MTEPGYKPPPEPWERQQGETEKAWEAFRAYRDMPSRSMRACASDLGKRMRNLERWAAQWKWRERVEAWDREVDRQRREAAGETAVEVGKRHAAEAMELQRAVLAPVRAYLARLEDARAKGEDPFENMTIAQLQQAAMAGVRMHAAVATFERLSRGMSTQNVGGHDGGPLEVRRREFEGKSRSEIDEFLLGIERSARDALSEVDGRSNGAG